MKIVNFWILIFVFFLGLTNANATWKAHAFCPYPQHEISVGYGYLSNDQLAINQIKSLGIGTLKDIGDKVKTYDSPSFSYIGPIYFTYKFFYKGVASVGVSIVYSQNRVKRQLSSTQILTDKFHMVSVMPRLDFYYIRHPKVALYGSVGVGAMMVKSEYGQHSSLNETGVSLAYQVTPLAVRVGRSFGLVVELGFGTLGVVNGGFSYRHYNSPWMGNM